MEVMKMEKQNKTEEESCCSNMEMCSNMSPEMYSKCCIQKSDKKESKCSCGGCC